MSNLPENVDFTQWADKFSQTMVNETFRILGAQGNKRGGHKAALYLAMCFLAKFVGALAIQSLNQKSDATATREEVCKETTNSFADAKARIQEAVSAGFAGAMTVFTGKVVDYYCQVKPVPEPVNKKPI